MDAAQSILQKAPPGDLEKNLNGFRDILKNNPDSLDALLKKYMVPFQVIEPGERAVKGEKPFLSCRYNRVGDKSRSPWTNQLYPADDKNADNKSSASSTIDPEDELGRLEATTNEVWDSYKNLYYGHEAVGSVYLKDRTAAGAFRGLFGVYKKSSSSASYWHSVSLVQVGEPGEETCKYRVETTVLVIVESSSSPGGDGVQVNVSAMLSKETSKECKISHAILAASHIENLGELIESNEMDLRTTIERVHIPKSVETVDTMLKEKEKSFKPAVNPLMGMIMDSSVLKKKIASKQDDGEKQGDEETIDTILKEKEKAFKPAVNPLMGMIMDSSVLKKKIAKQGDGE